MRLSRLAPPTISWTISCTEGPLKILLLSNPFVIKLIDCLLLLPLKIIFLKLDIILLRVSFSFDIYSKDCSHLPAIKCSFINFPFSSSSKSLNITSIFSIKFFFMSLIDPDPLKKFEHEYLLVIEESLSSNDCRQVGYSIMNNNSNCHWKIKWYASGL